MKGDYLINLRRFGHNVIMADTLMAGTVDAKSLKGNPMVQRENTQRMPCKGIFKNQIKFKFQINWICFDFSIPRK